MNFTTKSIPELPENLVPSKSDRTITSEELDKCTDVHRLIELAMASFPSCKDEETVLTNRVNQDKNLVLSCMYEIFFDMAELMAKKNVFETQDLIFLSKLVINKNRGTLDLHTHYSCGGTVDNSYSNVVHLMDISSDGEIRYMDMFETYIKMMLDKLKGYYTVNKKNENEYLFCAQGINRHPKPIIDEDTMEKYFSKMSD